jgi:selenocysteine lyase/cysteine desulfurase
MHGLNATLRWLADDIGFENVFGRTAELARYCHSQLASVDGLELLTPAEAIAGLVCFRLPGEDWVARLHERGVTMRWIPQSRALRASCAFFNTSDEVDRLVEALREGA